MNKNTFEEYLMEKHAEDYHGLDDDMPDAFEAWVSNLDSQEVGEYAEEWGEQLIEKLIEETFSQMPTAGESDNTIYLDVKEIAGFKQQLKAKWLGKEKHD